MHIYALKILFFQFLLKDTLNMSHFIKWILKSCHKYWLCKNEDVTKTQIVPMSTQKPEDTFHLLRTKQYRKFLISNNSVHICLTFFYFLPSRLWRNIFYTYIYTHTLTILLISPNPDRRVSYKQFFHFPEKLSIVITFPLTIFLSLFSLHHKMPCLMFKIHSLLLKSKLYISLPITGLLLQQELWQLLFSTADWVMRCISQLTLAQYE